MRCCRRSRANGVSMCRIESRPAKARSARWEYVFFIDVEGHQSDARVAAAIAELKARALVHEGAGLLSRRPATLGTRSGTPCRWSSIPASCPRPTCARSRRTSPASRSRSWRASSGSRSRTSSSSPRTRTRRGIGPRTRAAIEGALGEIARYPDGNGHRPQGGARSRRYGVDDGLDRPRQRLERRARARGARLPRPGPRRGLFAALLRGLPARHAGARRARHRGAGEGFRPRPRRDGGGDRRRDLRGLDRQPEQPDRHAAAAPRRWRPSSSACPSACWW